MLSLDAWRTRLASQSREIGWISGGMAVLVMSALSVGSFALKVHSLNPRENSQSQPACEVEAHFFGLPYSGRVLIDGQPVPSRLSLMQQSLRCKVTGLGDGPHKVGVELFSPFRTVRLEQTFTVDSTPPNCSLATPNGQVTAKTRCKLRGMSEPNATVILVPQGGQPLPQVPVDEHGKFLLEADLKPGWNQFQVRARDRAGNVSEREWRVFLDSESPKVQLERLVQGEGVKLEGITLEKSKARVRLSASDDSGKLASVRWSLDGAPLKPIAVKRGADGTYTSQWVIDNLAEGDRELAWSVVDKVGREQKGVTRFLVDSSEKLGERPLTLGARGADIDQLQERLRELKHYQGSISGVFDEETRNAVKSFQRSQGYEETGALTGQSLQALGPRIFVNLALCSLVLDRPGFEQKRYSVAVGAPGFATPAGRYKIVYKEKNPTWMPPDSPWAREAKAIPPGPGNPLGTRWIGLDSNSVGIHGTNADWTIGTAASHGCVRMHISEVEELYELVEPGVPVIILGGWEKSPELEHYWPSKSKPKQV